MLNIPWTAKIVLQKSAKSWTTKMYFEIGKQYAPLSELKRTEVYKRDSISDIDFISK